MLYALKKRGVTSIAIPLSSHKSVYNACAVFGIEPLTFEFVKNEYGVECDIDTQVVTQLTAKTQALLVTSPTYYGRVWEQSVLSRIRNIYTKILIVDGAHGGHLHYDNELHPNRYADMWVDGVHKSLPAFTQGAVVSAKDEEYAELLREAVDIFRTSSPSYPIMASVEYALKYPQNKELERLVRDFANSIFGRILLYEDYTKLCVLYGENAFEAEKYFEKKGIYPEFCDGNIVMFYLSPATTKKAFKALKRHIIKSFTLYPFNGVKLVHGSVFSESEWKGKGNELVELDESVGRVCAHSCGLFPPCTPLIVRGEKITEEKVKLLKNADNTFGLQENKISVFME
jgi:arginine/lysine/ornithine decarboxylase